MSDLMRQYEKLAAEDELRMRSLRVPKDGLLDRYERMAEPDDQRPMSELSSSLGDIARFIDESGSASEELCRALELVWEPQRDQARAAFELGLPRCESPIERRILPWLICQPYTCFKPSPCVLLPGESEKLEPFTVAVVPQLPIGRRRADFALAARREGPVRFVIVECDGELCHQDVHKDVARDAELMRSSRILDVHPITGKDIWRDPPRAALGAARALTWAWSKTNKSTQGKFGASS